MIAAIKSKAVNCDICVLPRILVKRKRAKIPKTVSYNIVSILLIRTILSNENHMFRLSHEVKNMQSGRSGKIKKAAIYIFLITALSAVLSSQHGGCQHP